MGKKIRKGGNVTPRHTFPIGEMMDNRSAAVLTDILVSAEIRAARNAAAIRRMHIAH